MSVWLFVGALRGSRGPGSEYNIKSSLCFDEADTESFVSYVCVCFAVTLMVADDNDGLVPVGWLKGIRAAW